MDRRHSVARGTSSSPYLRYGKYLLLVGAFCALFMTIGFLQSWFRGDTDMFAFGLFFAIVFAVLLICFIETCHHQIVRDVADLIRTRDESAP
ncbi:MAG TPA: hypothetical protein VM223_08815 [Planctomycetota bacterium]|nr:hypothetical protein [Planctomycetota bacterium]